MMTARDLAATPRSANGEIVEIVFQSTEYADIKFLDNWIHGLSQIHTADGVISPEVMQRLSIWDPTRIITNLLAPFGVEPVEMPLPAGPEALSTCFAGGTMIPWDVTPAIRLPELVSNPTEFAGEKAL